MSLYRVTLELESSDDYDDPSKWDWPTLIDTSWGVTVVDCQDVENDPRVGDRDVWANDAPPSCPAEDADGWMCTREPGHRMPHVAGNGENVCAVWRPA